MSSSSLRVFLLLAAVSAVLSLCPPHHQELQNSPRALVIKSMLPGHKAVTMGKENTIFMSDYEGTQAQKWYYKQKDGDFIFCSVKNPRKCIDAASAIEAEQLKATDRDLQKKGQRWRVVKKNDGNYLLLDRSGRSLDVQYGKDENGASVIAYPLHGQNNQVWMIENA